MSQSVSVLDEYKDEIIELAYQNLTNNDIVAQLLKTYGLVTSEASVRRAFERWEFTKPVIEKSGFTQYGDEASVTSHPYTADAKVNKAKKVAQMLEERGEDPEEWVIDSFGVNEWTGPGEDGIRTYHQTKATLKRKKPLELMLPGRIPLLYKFTPSKKFKHDGDEPERVLFLPDPQCPSHDEELHKRVQELIFDFKPHRAILLGDLGDFPDISRHPDKPELEAKAQEVSDSVVLYLYELKVASDAADVGTEWTLLAGNHDERVRTYQIKEAAKLYGVTPGKLPWEVRQEALLTIQNLYRLDEFDINYIDPKGGDYEHEQYIVSENLAAAHGWIATGKSGTSALKTLEHTGFSIVIGHTHRQSLVFKTFHDIHKNPYTLAACEAGTLAKVKGGLDYARNADWQAGLAAASVYEDETFNIDLGSFVENKLYFRDKRY